MGKITTFFTLILLVLSCESGLSPKPETSKSYLKVKLHFVKGVANWPLQSSPPPDSMIAVRIGAFRKFPTSNIVNDVIAGNVYFTLSSLPLYVDTASTTFEILNPPEKLEYIAAVWQYDTALTSQRVIGVYTETGDNLKPSGITIQPGSFDSIDINIDFDNLPPMPY